MIKINLINNTLRLIKFYTKNGLISLMLLIPFKKILRKLYAPHINSYDLFLKAIVNKAGLEIGGASPIFSKSGLCPVYGVANKVDNLNYSEKTLWNADKEGIFKYNNIILGDQYIGEASDIGQIINDKYDFVCSSHFIQHCANPIKVLQGISNVLKDDGLLLFIVPHKVNTFDHKRNVTTLQHMVDDFTKDVGESDGTHVNEIIDNHDLTRDDGVVDRDSFAKRCRNNYKVRGCHNHVFDEFNFFELLRYSKFNVNLVELWYPYHMIFICTKEGNNNYKKLTLNEINNLDIHGPTYLKPNYPL